MSSKSNQPSELTVSSVITETGVTGETESEVMRKYRVGDDAQTVAYLDGLYAKAKQQRWKFDRQWYVNLSYYFGKQWVTWLSGQSPDFAKLYEPTAPPWRVRLVVNRIRPIIRREMSKVLREKPTAFVIPSSTEDSDVAAAKAGEAIFEHLWRTMEMSNDMWLSQFWRCVCGVGFIKDWWDSQIPSVDGMGAISTEVVSPFHLFFSNLDQPRMDRQEFIIHQSLKSPDAVYTAYGVKVNADATDVGGGVIEQQYLSALNLEAGKNNQVAVKEIWIKPNTRYPRGALFVWAAGKLLYSYKNEFGEDAWPLATLEYPFTKFDGVPTGRFYGDSTILDLLPLQKELNRTRSQIIEAKNQMAKPQLLAPRGSIDANKITSEPGLVIFYQPGFQPPTPLPLAGLPSYVLQEVDRNMQDMADIAGQHEVSNGTVPGGVSAASALSFLQEQDDTMIAPIIESVERGIERLGRHFLIHVQQRWDSARKVKVLGADNTWEIHEFDKSSLSNNTDLNIQAGSGMPRSLAARQAFIMELIKLQIITPQQGLRYLEMAETSQMYEESQIDHRQAQRENMRMTEGMMVAVNSWDNHEAHIEAHNNFRKRQEYENLDPQLMTLFEEHVATHRAALGLPPEINPQQVRQMQALMPQGAGQSPEGGVLPPEVGGEVPPEELPVEGSEIGQVSPEAAPPIVADEGLGMSPDFNIQ